MSLLLLFAGAQVAAPATSTEGGFAVGGGRLTAPLAAPKRRRRRPAHVEGTLRFAFLPLPALRLVGSIQAPAEPESQSVRALPDAALAIQRVPTAGVQAPRELDYQALVRSVTRAARKPYVHGTLRLAVPPLAAIRLAGRAVNEDDEAIAATAAMVLLTR